MPTSFTYVILAPGALHLGDLMCMWIRIVTKNSNASLGFSRAYKSVLDTTREWCFIYGQTNFRDGNQPYKHKKTFPETFADVFKVVYVSALDDTELHTTAQDSHTQPNATYLREIAFPFSKFGSINVNAANRAKFPLAAYRLTLLIEMMLHFCLQQFDNFSTFSCLIRLNVFNSTTFTLS